MLTENKQSHTLHLSWKWDCVDISAKKKPNKDNDLNEMLLIPAEKSTDNKQPQDIVDSILKQTFDPQVPR